MGVDMNTQETLLAALRGRFGDSQTAIAEATGMSLSRVNNYIRGTRKMDDDTVIACCELLGWNAQKYVAAHRAETATTKREISFWRKIAGSAAALFVLVAGSALPGVGARDAQASVQSTTGASVMHDVCIMRSYGRRAGRHFLTGLQLVALWLKWKFSHRKAGPDCIEAFAC
ncbi:MAG: helix-turn-helix XRE-family like protein [Inoviridae sp.]|nr:MAG: helix-turn-helix XRE-family like protein [Inoviridae sp.]